MLALPLAAGAQPGGKVHRVGILTPAAATAPPAVLEGLRQRLRELGWIEGQTISFEYRFAGGNERLQALAAELVRLEPDVILALGTPAAVTAKGATGTVPVVMIGVGDPVGSGLVASLAHPGAIKSRLPSVVQFRETVEAGGLFSYGPSQLDLGRSGAAYVDRILKGAKPAALPVEQPTKLELVVNARTAKALGLTLPASLLLRADHVIQ